MSRPLELFGVYDRGVPGKERVVLRVNEKADLASYLMLLGSRAPTGHVTPFIDQCLWLGNSVIDGPGWVFVHTGIGRHTMAVEEHSRQPVHAIYWGKSAVLFSEQAVVPVLCMIGDVQLWERDRKVNEVVNIQGLIASARAEGPTT